MESSPGDQTDEMEAFLKQCEVQDINKSSKCPFNVLIHHIWTINLYSSIMLYYISPSMEREWCGLRLTKALMFYMVFWFSFTKSCWTISVYWHLMPQNRIALKSSRLHLRVLFLFFSFTPPAAAKNNYLQTLRLDLFFKLRLSNSCRWFNVSFMEPPFAPTFKINTCLGETLTLLCSYTPRLWIPNSLLKIKLKV